MAHGMKLWKGNGDTSALLFYLKGLEIVHQERRGHVNEKIDMAEWVTNLGSLDECAMTLTLSYVAGHNKIIILKQTIVCA